MKFKHYKFPPQTYPARISFKLIIESDLIDANEKRASLDSPLSIASVDSDADRTCMMNIPENKLEREK